MSDARTDILRQLKRHRAPVQAPPPLIPALDTQDVVACFEEKAIAAGATVQWLSRIDQADEAIARYLRDLNLPARCVISPDIEADFAIAVHGLDRVEASNMPNAVTLDGVTVIGACRTAVAETGTLVVTSGVDKDARLAYLAETYVVLVPVDGLVETYEAAWAKLKASSNGDVPRLVSFVTGPSRTADIEQTIERGAHGPRRLHILLIGENA